MIILQVYWATQKALRPLTQSVQVSLLYFLLILVNVNAELAFASLQLVLNVSQTKKGLFCGHFEQSLWSREARMCTL